MHIIDPFTAGLEQDLCFSDDRIPICKKRGAYLPHWTRDEGIYFVTFRLADSVPQSVLRRWLFERRDIVLTAQQMNRPLTASEEKRLARLFSERVEAYLDLGIGSCWLRLDSVAKIVADSLWHFDGIRYRLYVWAIMPNHVHALLKPLARHELSGIMHSWKSFTSTEANKYLKRKGQFWQEECHDHLVRDREEFVRAARYIRDNPMRAGLHDWKWVWIDQDVRGMLGGD